MKVRYLFAILFLVFELPVLLPIVGGAVVTGLVCGLQIAAERAWLAVSARRRAVRRPRERSLARPAIS